MPTERVPLQRPRRGHVTNAQWWELRLGPNPSGSVFTSKEELKSAWERAREGMMAFLNPGRRAMGWWEFDAEGLRYPGYDLERSVLWRAGKLRADERLTLEREWRAEFETAQAPDFMLNDGSGELLKGDCARAAHYRHHDIPRELVRRWEVAARRRRARARGAESGAASEAAQEKAPGAVSGIRGEEESTGLQPDANTTAAALK